MDPLAPTPHIRHLPRIAAAVLLPFTIFTLYLLFSRWPEYWFTETSDFIALVLSVVSAAICIWLIKVPLHWRLIVLLGFLPALCFGLMMYSFFFVCAAFDECL